MKQVLKGTAAFFLAVVLTLGQMSVLEIYGGASVLTPYTTKRTEDKSWYVHTFDGGGSFLTSVDQGSITYRPVSVVVPSGITLTGDEYVDQAEASQMNKGTLYKFSAAGTCSVVVTVQDSGGKRRYGRFYFTILSSPETSGEPAAIVKDPQKQPFRVVSHQGGSSYKTTIKEGDVLKEPAVVFLIGDMEAAVLHNGRTTEYKSGSELRDPGAYKMTFTSSFLGRKEISSLSFSIGEIVEPEQEDFGVSYPIDPSRSINPNMVDVGKPAVGSWTFETALKNGSTGNSAGESGKDKTGNSEESGKDKTGNSGESGKDRPEKSTKDPLKVTELNMEKPGTETSEVRLLGTKEEDGDQDASWSSGEEDLYTGPGAIVNEEESTAGAPKEVMVELTEYYHEDYKLYELSFAGQYFFYSNVGDGDVTSKSKPVLFDVPANISVKAQKDGNPIEYNNKARISEPGTYTFELSVLEGQEKPVEEQTIYKAVYHFRIEEKEPETESSQDSLEAVAKGFEDETPITFSASDEEEELDSFGETQKEVSEEEMLELGELDEEQMTEDGLKSMEDIDRLVEELTTPEVKEDDGSYKEERYTGLEESYDAEKDQYRQKLRSGTVFYANVPSGMVTNKEVTLDIPADVTVTATRDDQPFEYIPGEPVVENGVYRFEFQEDKVEYITAYEKPPFFTFRIVENAVNDIEVLNMPQGFEVVSVFMEDEDLGVQDPGRVFLKRDGSYRVVMSFLETDKEYKLDIVKDTQAPQFVLDGIEDGKSTGTEVYVKYLSEDINHVELYRDGIKDESFTGGSITDPGNYQLLVYDQAGNASSARFQFRYKMNLAAVTAVILVLLIAATLLVYVKRVKKDVSVR